MGARRFAVVGALGGTVVLAGWVAVSLAGLGSLGIEGAGAPIEDTRAASVTSGAEHADAPPATAIDEDGVAVADVESGDATFAAPGPVVPAATPPVLLASASTADPIEDRRAASVTSGAEHVDAPPATAMGEDGIAVADIESGGAALPDSGPTHPTATPPVLLASLSTADPVQNGTKAACELRRNSRRVPCAGNLYRRIPLVAVPADAESRHQQGIGADQGNGQEEGQNADCHQNHYEVRRGRLHVEGSDSGTKSRHVAEGLRDRRHGSWLQAEALSRASGDGRRRAYAGHNERLPG